MKNILLFALLLASVSSGQAASKRFNIAAYRGRPVLLHFWAPWCSNCAAEIPAIKKMAAAHPDLAVIFITDMKYNSRSEILAYARKHGIRFPLVFDFSDAISDEYHTQVLPTNIWFDSRGRARDFHSAETDWQGEYIDKLIRKLR